jgi:hypothetical protein
MYNDTDLTENLRWYANRKIYSFSNKNKLNGKRLCDCHEEELIQNHNVNTKEHPGDYD